LPSSSGNENKTIIIIIFITTIIIITLFTTRRASAVQVFSSSSYVNKTIIIIFIYDDYYYYYYHYFIYDETSVSRHSFLVFQLRNENNTTNVLTERGVAKITLTIIIIIRTAMEQQCSFRSVWEKKLSADAASLVFDGMTPIWLASKTVLLMVVMMMMMLRKKERNDETRRRIRTFW
jgi:hypothetical protein